MENNIQYEYTIELVEGELEEVKKPGRLGKVLKGLFLVALTAITGLVVYNNYQRIQENLQIQEDYKYLQSIRKEDYLLDIEYNIYKNDTHDIIYDTGVTQEELDAALEIIETADGYERGYTIILTTRDVKEYLLNMGYNKKLVDNLSVVGGATFTDGSIDQHTGYIVQPVDFMDWAFIHELGHAVDYQYGLSHDEDFERYFSTAKRGRTTYKYSSEEEFFAECYKEYQQGTLKDGRMLDWFKRLEAFGFESKVPFLTDAVVLETVSTSYQVTPLEHCEHGNSIYEDHYCRSSVILKTMNGVEVEFREAFEDLLNVVESDDSYNVKYKYAGADMEKLEMDRIELIQKFLKFIYDCEEDTVEFQITEFGIDNWAEFENDVVLYSTGFYIDRGQGYDYHLVENWRSQTDPEGNIINEWCVLDIQRIKNILSQCTQDMIRIEQENIYVEDCITELVKQLDLTGNKVHDLFEIHNFVVDYTDYDHSEENEGRSPYDFFFKRKVVCEGYARVFNLICKSVGMKDIYMEAGPVGDGAHAWNVVYIDGEKYYIDPTWNDKDDEGYQIFWFLLPENQFYVTHNRETFE